MKTETLERTEESAEIKRLRVLLVENEPHDVELILFELRSSGSQVQHRLVEREKEFREAPAEELRRGDFRLPSAGLDGIGSAENSARERKG